MSTSLEKIIGGYLFIEGWASIAYSQDQRSLSNIGRLGRMGIVKKQHSAVNMAIFKVIETMIKSGFFIKEVDQPRLTTNKGE